MFSSAAQVCGHSFCLLLASLCTIHWWLSLVKLHAWKFPWSASTKRKQQEQNENCLSACNSREKRKMSNIENYLLSCVTSKTCWSNSECFKTRHSFKEVHIIHKQLIREQLSKHLPEHIPAHKLQDKMDDCTNTADPISTPLKLKDPLYVYLRSK